MGSRKYELTNISMEFGERTLYRIRALRDFSDVKKGDLGGWVSSEDNLSQEGDCWIYNEAKCMDSAKIYDNSTMYDYSEMYDYSIMRGDSEMHNYTEMHDYSKMYSYSKMYDNAEMHDNSKMYGNSTMYGNSMMCGNSRMFDYSEMFDDSAMYGNSTMNGYSIMFGNSELYDDSEMHGRSRMYGDSILKDEEKLYGELISKVDKFIDISNPKGEMVTGVLKDGEVLFNVGNLSEINKEEFLDILYNGNEIIEESSSRKEYLKIINIIVLYLLG